MLDKSRVLLADKLLRLSGDEFITACYRSILWREPDPSGRAHYLALIIKGEDKVAIAAAIASSDEARALPPGKKGLMAEILALHANKLIGKAWTSPQRRKAAEQVSRYLSIVSGFAIGAGTDGGGPGGRDADPFSSYYTSVIEDRNS